MSSFEIQIREELETLSADGLFRTIDSIETGCFSQITIDGQTFLNFCSNNYLALNGHPYIANAMKKAIDLWGTSCSASRLIVGNIKLFEEAEERLAGFKRKEAALIFPSGYQANVSVIATLASPEDNIFSDQLNHASIIDGCKLSRAKLSIYRHRDANNLEDLLKDSKSRRKIIVTDGVFSMDGDIAPLKEISELADRYDAVVIVDDAHATGVLGNDGRGTLELFDLQQKENIMVLGTGGKALGVGGAFFCCPDYVKQYLINKSRGFIYTTATVPAIPAGLMASLDVVVNEPDRRKRLNELSNYFHHRLKAEGFMTSKTPSHILPLIIGDNQKVIDMALLLRKNGIYVKPIRFPTVPKGTERIRFSLTSHHTKEDVDKVIDIIKSYISLRSKRLL